MLRQLALLLGQRAGASAGVRGFLLERGRLLACTSQLQEWALPDERKWRDGSSGALHLGSSSSGSQCHTEEEIGWQSCGTGHVCCTSETCCRSAQEKRIPLSGLQSGQSDGIPRDRFPGEASSANWRTNLSFRASRFGGCNSPHLLSTPSHYPQSDFNWSAAGLFLDTIHSAKLHQNATKQPVSATSVGAAPVHPALPSPPTAHVPLQNPTTPSIKGSPSAGAVSKSPPLKSGVFDGPSTPITQWLQRICPPQLWPYVQLGRYDKPIGTWLLAWPCFWSIALAAPPGALPDPVLMAWFGAGAVVMRGAGCTVNDMWDRDIDSKVARTRDRPLASKRVSPRKAFLFLAAQSTVGLGVLLQLNDFSKALGASSLFLVATYPLMKRITSWPQAYLGLTFNWGALLGWSAVKGSLFLPAVAPLYAAGICWTLVYDTIYAHQDKEDDKLVGVKSTALRFGQATPQWLAGFGVATLAGLAASGAAVGLEWPFYAGLTAAGAHLTWQIATLRMDDRADCSAKFVANKWFGAIVFASIVAGKLAAG